MPQFLIPAHHGALQGGVWTPASPTDDGSVSPSLWLDASQIVGLSDGNAVTTWEDASASGNDASQSDAAAKPTYKVGIMNGNPVVRFDGGDWLDMAALINMGNFSIIIVQQTSGDDIFWSHTVGTAPGVNRQLRIGKGAANVLSMYLGGDDRSSSTLSTARTSPAAIGFFRSSSTGYFYENGTARGSGAVGTEGSSLLTFGCFYFNVTRSNYVVGDIAEVIMYSSYLSDADRSQVYGYVNTKYGLTAP